MISNNLKSKSSIFLYLLVIAFGYFYFQSSKSPEDKVKIFFKLLETETQLTENRHPFEQLTRVQRLLHYVDDSVFFESPFYEISEREFSKSDLEKKFYTADKMLASLETKIEINSIDIADEYIRVELIANAMGQIKNAEGKFFDRHRVSVILLTSDNGDLVISEVIHLENERD